MDTKTLEWLLDGDPAIRWQVMKDLLDRAPSTVSRERAQVAKQGWGNRLLELQDADGTWGGGIYSPKWISTTYTLLLLWRMGLSPTNQQARRGCQAMWDWVIFDNGITRKTATSAPDICISAFWLTLSDYFGHEDDRIPTVIEWVLDNQLGDGGWNCDQVRSGSTHGSFHTSIQVMEALAQIDDRAHDQAAARGREFFLDHHMYRSHRTGAIAHPNFTKLSFPPRWRYDILRGLDHFRAVDAPVDARADDALAVLRSKQRNDGLWPVQHKHSGRVWFDMESGRQPSRWNTLRALRVLRWAE